MNTSPIKWSQCSLGDFNGPLLAWHTACLVLPSEVANNPKINIYKLPEEKVERRITIKVNINKIIIFPLFR